MNEKRPLPKSNVGADALQAVQQAEVVKLHMFAGLELREIAALLGTSEKTVQRDWTFAKAWLTRELKDAP